LVVATPPHLRTSLLVLAAIAALTCLASLLVGAVTVAPREIFAALLGGGSELGTVVRDLRLPRVLLAFGVGGALAVSGATLQAVVRNPLAEPWLLGLSGGASLGAVLAVVVGLPPGWTVSIAASVGALAAIALVYRIATVADRRLDPRVLVLAGVVVGALAAAMSTAIVAVADPFTFRAAALWLFGGFAGAHWEALWRFTIIAVPVLLIMFWMGRSLDLLALGDDSAAALGVSVDRVRRGAVVAAAVLTAASVSAAGVIGFVGLVVPHALRWMIGPLHRGLIPAAFLAGGAFTVAADTLARTLLSPAELPVGVVTALVGVPVFAMLLRRSAT
jgi:iron complex transport system permease protein